MANIQHLYASRPRADEVRKLLGQKQPDDDVIRQAKLILDIDFYNLSSMAPGNTDYTTISAYNRMLAYGAMEESGTTDQARGTWIAREAMRMASGYYDMPEALYGGYLAPILMPWFVHRSREDADQLAYTPTDEYGRADRQVRMRPEALLRKLVPAISDVELRDIVAAMKAEKDPHFHVAHDRETVEAVYTNMVGDNGCMRHDKSCFHDGDFIVHPSAVYACEERGLGVAYLKDNQGRYSARCVIYTSPDGTDKRMVRVYGSLLLERKLRNAGYVYKSLHGLTLPAIKAAKDRDGGVPRWATPYLDAPRGDRASAEHPYLLPIRDALGMAFSIESDRYGCTSGQSTTGCVAINERQFVADGNLRVLDCLNGYSIRRGVAAHVITPAGTRGFSATRPSAYSAYRQFYTTDDEEIYVSTDYIAALDATRKRKMYYSPSLTEVEPIITGVRGGTAGNTNPPLPLHPAYDADDVKAYAYMSKDDSRLRLVKMDGVEGYMFAEHCAFLLKSFRIEVEDGQVTEHAEGDILPYGPNNHAPRASTKRMAVRPPAYSVSITTVRDAHVLSNYGKLLAPADADFVVDGTVVDPAHPHTCGVVDLLEGGTAHIHAPGVMRIRMRQGAFYSRVSADMRAVVQACSQTPAQLGKILAAYVESADDVGATVFALDLLYEAAIEIRFDTPPEGMPRLITSTESRAEWLLAAMSNLDPNEYVGDIKFIDTALNAVMAIACTQGWPLADQLRATAVATDDGYTWAPHAATLRRERNAAAAAA